MDFNIYSKRIQELLIQKATNNYDREAVIKVNEIDMSLTTTMALTQILKKWLDDSGMVDQTIIIGKGCIQCIVKKIHIEEDN